MLPQLSGVVLEGIEGTIGGAVSRCLPSLGYQRDTTTTTVALRLGPPYLAQT